MDSGKNRCGTETYCKRGRRYCDDGSGGSIKSSGRRRNEGRRNRSDPCGNHFSNRDHALCGMWGAGAARSGKGYLLWSERRLHRISSGTEHCAGISGPGDIQECPCNRCGKAVRFNGLDRSRHLHSFRRWCRSSRTESRRGWKLCAGDPFHRKKRRCTYLTEQKSDPL